MMSLLVCYRLEVPIHVRLGLQVSKVACHEICVLNFPQVDGLGVGDVRVP